MGNETRATMIEGAIQLLATRGVHGASLLKVLEHTGAPRGSVYHHFPGGKEELILAALDLTGQRHDRFVDRFRGTSAEEITAGYLELWRRILIRSRLESGCPILAVTVSASAGPLLDRAGEIFRTSQRHLVDLYEEVGVVRAAAERFVTFLVASAEGAVVLARAQQAIEPFEVVADQLTRASGGDAKGGLDDRWSPGIGDEDASEASARRRLLDGNDSSHRRCRRRARSSSWCAHVSQHHWQRAGLTSTRLRVLAEDPLPRVCIGSLRPQAQSLGQLWHAASKHHRPFKAFLRDYRKLPTVAFVTMCHGMHDCLVHTGARWIKSTSTGTRAGRHRHNSWLIDSVRTRSGESKPFSQSSSARRCARGSIASDSTTTGCSAPSRRRTDCLCSAAPKACAHSQQSGRAKRCCR